MQEFFRRGPKQFTSARRDDTQVPDHLWSKCPKCHELIYTKQLQEALKVCPKCGYHHRLSAREWLANLDPGSFRELDPGLVPLDVLGFGSEQDDYGQKLREAQQKTGLRDAVVSGTGTVGGMALVVAICDFGFMGGSMGSVFGEKVARAAEYAAVHRLPLLTINTSGGARMQEGVLALMQMAKISVALTRLAAARQPHFSLMIDPCFGGVAASYASIADVVMAEPGAVIGFAGPRVVEQTIRQKLPPDFSTAEFQLQHGMIDMIVARNELRTVLARLLRLYDRMPAPAELALAGHAALV